MDQVSWLIMPHVSLKLKFHLIIQYYTSKGKDSVIEANVPEANVKPGTAILRFTHIVVNDSE